MTAVFLLLAVARAAHGRRDGLSATLDELAAEDEQRSDRDSSASTQSSWRPSSGSWP